MAGTVRETRFALPGHDAGGDSSLKSLVPSLRALAKQSILAPIRKLDCFVVSLLAMTARAARAAVLLSLLREAWGGWLAVGQSGGGCIRKQGIRSTRPASTPTRLTDRFALSEPPSPRFAEEGQEHTPTISRRLDARVMHESLAQNN